MKRCRITRSMCHKGASSEDPMKTCRNCETYIRHTSRMFNDTVERGDKHALLIQEAKDLMKNLDKMTIEEMLTSSNSLLRHVGTRLERERNEQKS